MLRTVAIVLLAANLLFFGFTRGWFDGLFGLSAIGDREPERLASQVRPNEIILTPMNAPSASSLAARGGCLEAGPIAAADAAAAESILKIALAPGSWVDERNESLASGAAVVTHTYRVAAAEPAIAARLVALKLDASGRGFSSCAKPGDAIR